MAHLSSCYFCGTALDEPLGTYGVGGETTVTLCPTCRRKLETVLGTAEGTLSDAGTDATATDDGPTTDPGPSDTADPETDPADPCDESADETGADLFTAAGGDDAPDDEASLGTGIDPDADDEFETVEATDEPGESSAGGPGTTGGETAVEGGGNDGESDDDPAGEQSQASLSALEYNRVMRLLQNREFPVDRTEIETVAANAYDLSRSDCAAVIDLAVDRGLLDEDDGQLSRPE